MRPKRGSEAADVVMKLKKLQELSRSDKRVIETLMEKNKQLKKELAAKEEVLVAL